MACVETCRQVQSTLVIMQYQTDTRIKCVQAWLKGLCASKQKICGQAKQMKKSVKKILEERKFNTVKLLYSSLMPLNACPTIPWWTFWGLGSIIGVFKLETFCSPLLWSMHGVPEWVPNWCYPINWGPFGVPRTFWGLWLWFLLWCMIGAPNWGPSPLWSLNWGSRSESPLKSPRGLCMGPAGIPFWDIWPQVGT